VQGRGWLILDDTKHWPSGKKKAAIAAALVGRLTEQGNSGRQCHPTAFFSHIKCDDHEKETPFFSGRVHRLRPAMTCDGGVNANRAFFAY
jgi:hypothetical protein